MDGLDSQCNAKLKLLFGSRARIFYHLRVFRDLGLDVIAERFGCRQGERQYAQCLEARPDVGRGKGAIDFGVHLDDDVPRQAARTDETVPLVVSRGKS